MRNLKKTLAMMSLLSPLTAHALGVGDIELQSSLNQNLKAEIPLISSRGESVSDIRVSLASPAAFARANIERSFYLSALRFQPELQADGRIVVKVSSLDVIREPFLDFLVEVNWPQGRIIREFTLLLDPPVTFKKKTVTITTPPVVKTQPVTEPSTTATSRIETTTWEPVVAPPSRFSERPTGPLNLGDEYGPIARNETLWKIVKSVQTDDGITDEQLLIAIYENNRHAFYKKNINALKQGQTIKIPERDVVLGLTKTNALAEYKRQNQVWSGRISDTPPSEATARDVAATGSQSQQLKLLTPIDTTESGVGASAQDGRSKAELALEMAATANQENQELKSRLNDLEKQLETMQRLLSLKNEELAVMQVQKADQTQPVPTANEAVSEIGKGAENQQPKTQAGVVKQAAKPAPKQPKAAKSPIPQKQNDLVSELLSEPMYLAAGGSGIILLIILALVAFKKRRSAFAEDAEDVLGVSDSIGNAADEESIDSANAKSKKDEIGAVAESSFLSEFTPSDFDALESDTDEVDPISEADVYLAYGRYQQAEDLIRQAISDKPERDECKLKLLEIYFAKESAEGFETYAAEVAEDKQNDPEFWGKVVEMGKELCPSNPLFTETNSEFDTSSLKLNEDETDILEEEFSGGTSATDSKELGENDMSDPDLQSPAFDLDVEAINEVDQNSSSEGQDEQADNVDLEFDVSSSQANEEQGIEGDLPQQSELDSESNQEIEGLEFEPGISTVEASEDSMETSESSGEDDTILEFPKENLESENGSEDLSPELENMADSEEPEVASTSDLELSMDNSVSSDDQAADDVSSLTDMDEVETKLDLAKAYVDMEDGTAAREILEEIVEHGNEEQQSEAQKLMEQLEVKG